MGGFSARPGVSAPNVGMRPGMSLGFGPSQYGPYQGGYQFASQPTISGLPNTRTSYGVSLPNFGAMPQGNSRSPGFGGGGARAAFNFGGYASPAHRAASIQAAQDAMRASRNTATGERQMHNQAF